MENDFALVDVWCNLHPALGEYTWFNSSQSIGSRLDKFLISRDLLSPGIECDISPCLISDHDFVSLVLDTTTPPGSNTARVCGILIILFHESSGLVEVSETIHQRGIDRLLS